ncbi:MAG TPA: DUF3857 domain-containing protein [Bryobacteraceae bacterium]|nr:DUF3857 domain-containing protein [Bryobacteraceae bacterium]
MRAVIVSTAFMAAACALARAGDEAPQWARDAAATAPPKYEAKVAGVHLLHEQEVTVDDTGKRVITTREVWRPLTAEGRKEALAMESYLNGTGKVKELQAWLIMPSGKVKRYGKDKVMDVGMPGDDVYDDYRYRVISATNEADPGTVFAYEAVSEDKSIFTQFEFEFQDRMPSLLSRFVLNLPPGWRADGVTFNNDAVKPAISGSTYTWEMRNLPFIEEEPESPNVSSLAPRLGVSFFPPGPVKNAGPAFSNWADVSRFQGQMLEGTNDPSDEMVAKTRQLIAGSKSEFDRIAAIGRYVQTVHYIEISTRLGRGGGYHPHAASQVFAKNYGDCKDKANLMRTMLRIAGIEAKPVVIEAYDRLYTRSEWPSPWQFNHMIVAVAVSPETKAPAVIEPPGLGRLLLFDPTNDMVPPGLLPSYEQDSLALVIAGDKGALVRTPALPPDTSRFERETEVTLEAGGGAAVKVRDHLFGDSAAAIRRRYSQESHADYVKRMERMLAESVPAPVIKDVSVSDSESRSELQRAIEFTTDRAGQLMQNRLLVFRPAMAGRPHEFPFAEKTRRYPVVLNSEAFHETVRVHLPAGFDVDEIPDPVKLDAPFGSFEEKCTVDHGALLFQRSLEVKAATVPPDQYKQVRDFFGHVAGAEQAEVVLVRK